jgi:hypothetical protein
VLGPLSADLMAVVSPALLASGRMDVISIADIRDQAGPRWAQISETVHARLGYLLGSYLGTTDCFARLDETTYVVTMPTADPDELDIICLHALYDLHCDFLGRCENGHIRIARALTGNGKSALVLPLPRSVIATLAERVGIAGLSDDALAPFEVRRIAAPDPPPAEGARQSASGVARTGENMIVEKHFLPVWNAARSAVLTYRCIPKTITMSDRRVPPAHLTEAERIAIELACLDEGIGQLTGLGAQHVRFVLGIQVSFEVLGSPRGRRELVLACRAVSCEYRDYIEFFLTNVPPGAAQTRLANMATLLKSYGRRVSVTVAPHARSISAYQGIGIHAVGLDLEEYPRGDLSYVEDARRLVALCAKSRQETFAIGIRDTYALDAVHDAGIQYLSGTAVVPACERPEGVRLLTWEDLKEKTAALG